VQLIASLTVSWPGAVQLIVCSIVAWSCAADSQLDSIVAWSCAADSQFDSIVAFSKVPLDFNMCFEGCRKREYSRMSGLRAKVRSSAISF
jgi:hypothetical protein